VKPETADDLAKARKDLGEARQIIRIGLANVAARSTYYAAFHAAEALIFEWTGRVAKTHKGVRSEFARLTKDDPHVPKTVMAFLTQAYGYKEISDYSVDPDEMVTMANAETAIISAESFLDRTAATLA
jgi:uncharacterized protein (UPF0332 family)